MLQKQYSLTDFSLISVEEGAEDINDIFLVKKDPAGEIIEYYAEVGDLSRFKDDKKVEDFLTYARDNQYVSGLISLLPDKETVDAFYISFRPVDLEFIKSFVRGQVESVSNKDLRDKSENIYVKFAPDLTPGRVYYKMESFSNDDKLAFLQQIESYLGRSIITQLNSIAPVEDVGYYIFTEKDNDQTMYINKLTW